MNFLDSRELFLRRSFPSLQFSPSGEPTNTLDFSTLSSEEVLLWICAAFQSGWDMGERECRNTSRSLL